MKKIAILIICLCTLSMADEWQLWTQLFTQGKVGENLRVSAEFQPRYGFETKGFTTLMLRPAVGWQLSPAFTVWAGYAWTPLLNPTWRNEHRLWQQGTHVMDLGTFRLSQRLRLEERFIDGASTTAFRLRYQTRFAFALNNEKTFSAILSNEVFFALNSALPAASSGFDQNRLMIGANQVLCPELNMDFGYLWNAINSVAPKANKTNHVLVLTLNHSF